MAEKRGRLNLGRYLFFFFIFFLISNVSAISNSGTATIQKSSNLTISPSNYLSYSQFSQGTNFEIYFKNNSNTAESVRFEKDGYFFTYDLSGGQMLWKAKVGQPAATDTLGGGQPSNSQNTQIQVSGNEVLYPRAFSNTNVSYTLKDNMIKENFILYSLPSIKDYLYLEYSGNIKFNSSLKICANNQCYIPSGNQDDFETSGRIEFQDTNGKVRFYIPEPIITDRLGNKIAGTYLVHGSNAQMNFYLRIPKSFLAAGNYPYYIDPSIVSEQETAKIVYNFDYGQTNITLRCVNETPSNLFVYWDNQQNEFIFGANANFSDVRDCNYTLNSNKELVPVYLKEINTLSAYNYYPNGWNELRQVYSFLPLNVTNYTISKDKKTLTAFFRSNGTIKTDSIINVSGCMTLNSQGEYKLNTSLSSSDTCFVFNNNSIIFDCDNYHINQSGSLKRTFYSAYFNNLTIKNCWINVSGSNSIAMYNLYGSNISYLDNQVYTNFYGFYTAQISNYLIKNIFGRSSSNGLISLHGGQNVSIEDGNLSANSNEVAFDAGGDECSGNNLQCANITDVDTCAGTYGCYKFSQCSGTITNNDCSIIPLDECDTTNSCYQDLDYSCSGTPDNCGQFDDLYCDSISGCSYIGGVCIGVPDAGSCSGVYYVDCDAYSSCYRPTVCKDYIEACAYIQNEVSCDLAGCSWGTNKCQGWGQPTCSTFGETACVGYTSGICSWSSPFLDIINVSYSHNELNTQILRRWWKYQAYANDTDGSDLEGVSISVFNSSGLYSALTTQVNGRTEVINLLNYIIVASTKTFQLNYTINATYDGVTSSRSYNVTLAKNIYDIYTFVKSVTPQIETIIRQFLYRSENLPQLTNDRKFMYRSEE